MSYKKSKRKYIILIVVMVCVLYIFTYLYARQNYDTGKVVYYDTNDWVYYGGMEYKIGGAKVYTYEEFIEEFEEELDVIPVSMDKERLYILLLEQYRRIEESDGKEKGEYMFTLTSRFWTVSPELELEGNLMSANKSFYTENVKVGEEGERYRVYSLNKEANTKKVMDSAKEATVYFEMLDYEGSEYLRRVRVMN